MPSKNKNYADKVSNELFKIIKDNCEDKCACKMTQDENDNKYYSIVGTYFFADDDLNKSVRIIKLCNIYWLSFAVKFNIIEESTKHNIYDLDSIFIKVFKENKEDTSKELKFRAEWSVFDSKSKHAQPHWHLYPVIRKHVCKGEDDFNSLVVLNSELNSFLEEPKENDSPSGKSKSDFEGFHFAMASNWHNKINEHTIKFSNEMTKKWLEGCIKYIKVQLSNI